MSLAGPVACRDGPAGPGALPPALVHLSPDTLDIAFASTARLSVSVTDPATGRPLDPRLYWTVRNEAVVELDTAGLLRARGLGETWVLVSDSRSLDSTLVRVWTRFVSVHAGTETTCALGVTGHAFCWGWNEFGQAGNGTTRDALAPTLVATSQRFAALSTGGGTTCGLHGGAGLLCWGYNGVGQLADGTIQDRSVPVQTATALSPESVRLGAGTTPCVQVPDGDTWCWAWNAYGQLLDGTRVNRREPVRLAVGTALRQVTAGGGHVCGLDAGGAAWCWGRNDRGQLGDASAATREEPASVAGPTGLVGLALGEAHVCAWTADGAVWCWGSNEYGQSGGTNIVETTPVRVAPQLAFDTLATTRDHTCGLVDSVAWCWGRNDYAQLGVSGGGTSPVPVRVATDLRFSQISAGTSHSCGMATDGLVYCWGRGSFGSLGTGTRTGSVAPVRVRHQR